MSALKTARLVCRAFRTASISIITYLSYDSRTARRSIEPLILAHDVHGFTSVSKLDLHLSLPQCTAMLKFPPVFSALCTLHLVKGREEPSPALSLAALAPLLAAATQLTTLWVEGSLLDQPDSGFQLAYALGACCGIQELRLGKYTGDVAQAVLQVSTLRTLRCDRDEDWAGTISSLTGLHSLGVVLAETDEDIQTIAVLTQLTHLDLDFDSDTVDRVTELSSLASLRVLCSDNPICMEEVVEIIQPMAELRELTIFLIWPDLGALDSLLASRPLISSLRLTGATWTSRDAYDIIDYANRLPPFPDSFLPNGFAGLRHLSMVLKPVNPGDVCEFSTVLTGLESLEVFFETAICRDLFLSRLRTMPRLTELQVCALEVRPGSQARFLAGLPLLRSLKLVGVLDVRHWDDDVKHITALSELKQLTLESTYFDRYTTDVTSAQVKPLKALKQLECLSVSPPWAEAVGALDFQEALQAVRHDMGFPPTDIGIFKGFD
jgi:hypothetical protein